MLMKTMRLPSAWMRLASCGRQGQLELVAVLGQHLVDFGGPDQGRVARRPPCPRACAGPAACRRRRSRHRARPRPCVDSRPGVSSSTLCRSMMSQPGRLNSAGVSRWVSRLEHALVDRLGVLRRGGRRRPGHQRRRTQQAVVSVLNMDGFRELERGGQGKLEGAPRSRAEGGRGVGGGRDGAEIVLVEQVVDVEAQLDLLQRANRASRLPRSR